MRERISSSCLPLSAFVPASAKCVSGMVVGSRCGLTNAAAAGIATCEWISMVVLDGRTSRPGLPSLRAAVGPYLFHCAGMRSPFLENAEMLRDDGIVEPDRIGG